MFIGPSVPELCRREDLAATLLRHGVNMMPAGIFVAGRALADHAVRIDLACAAERRRLARRTARRL